MPPLPPPDPGDVLPDRYALALELAGKPSRQPAQVLQPHVPVAEPVPIAEHWPVIDTTIKKVWLEKHADRNGFPVWWAYTDTGNRFLAGPEHVWMWNEMEVLKAKLEYERGKKHIGNPERSIGGGDVGGSSVGCGSERESNQSTAAQPGVSDAHPEAIGFDSGEDRQEGNRAIDAGASESDRGRGRKKR